MRKIGDAYYNTNELIHLQYSRNLKPVNKVLEKTLKELGIYDRIIAAKIEKSWADIVGYKVAQHTAEIQIINDRLYVKILSPALRQDLHMRKKALLAYINKSLGTKIEEIVIY